MSARSLVWVESKLAKVILSFSGPLPELELFPGKSGTVIASLVLGSSSILCACVTGDPPVPVSGFLLDSPSFPAIVRPFGVPVSVSGPVDRLPQTLFQVLWANSLVLLLELLVFPGICLFFQRKTCFSRAVLGNVGKSDGYPDLNDDEFVDS